MARWCRLLLFALVPLLSAVPVDAIVCCVFQPVTCTPSGCLPEESEPEGCGGCSEESSDSESPEKDIPTECCCMMTVVAEAGQAAALGSEPPSRPAVVRIVRLEDHITPPETPPPLR